MKTLDFVRSSAFTRMNYKNSRKLAYSNLLFYPKKNRIRIRMSNFYTIYLLLFAQSKQAIALHAKMKNCWSRENCFKQNKQRTHDRLSIKDRGTDATVDIFLIR